MHPAGDGGAVVDPLAAGIVGDAAKIVRAVADRLRSLGSEDVRVRLTRNVSAEVRVSVEPDADSADLSFDEVVAEVEEAEAIEQEDAEAEGPDEDSEDAEDAEE